MTIDDSIDASILIDAVFHGELPANLPWSTKATGRPGYWLIRAVGAQFDADGLGARTDEYLAIYPDNVGTLIAATGARTDGRPLVASLVRHARRSADAARAVAEAQRLPDADRDAVVASIAVPQ